MRRLVASYCTRQFVRRLGNDDEVDSIMVSITNGRVLFFDIARALCVVWIVLFWHGKDYLNADWSVYNHNVGFITDIALACFTFISGFFLGKKRRKAVDFYKARLKRFIVPLVVSCLIVSVFGWFDSAMQFLFTITGLSCFFLPQPATFWYFAMVIVFYLITPPLLYKTDGKLWRIILRGVIVYLVFTVLYQYGHCDKRLLLYFPYYLAGICLTMDNVKYLLTKKYILVSVICLFFLTFYISDSYNLMGGGKRALGVYLLIALSYCIERYMPAKVTNVFSIVAYASMFAYLFHREGYGVLQLVLVDIMDVDIPVALLLIMTLAIFVGSYYAQKCYDWLLKKYGL